MIKVVKRLFFTCICSLLLITQIISPIQVQAKSKNDEDYQIFLSQYLVNNYLLDDLNQMMIHQYFYAYLKEQNGIVNTAVTLTNMANDWGYAINGKEGLYEQVLIELIYQYVSSEQIQENYENYQERIELELFDTVRDCIDFTQLAIDHKELADKLLKLETWSWKDLLEIPIQYYEEYLDTIVNQFELPVSSSYFLNLGMDIVDCLYEISIYQSFSDHFESIYNLLEIMYRQTQNAELRVALNSVMKKLRTANHKELWNIVGDTFKTKAALTTMKELTMSALTTIGLGIDTGGFLSDVIFNTKTLAECQLMLEVELDIEKSIKDVIQYKQNNYMDMNHARIFNTAFMFLFNAYDYGIGLCEKYNEAVFETAKQIYLDNPKEFISKIKQKAKDIEFANSKHDYEKFSNAIQTYSGIVNTSRSVFDSAWNEYSSDIKRNVNDFLKNYLNQSFIQGIKFLTPQITLDMNDRKESILLDAPSILSSDTNQVAAIQYESSDPTVLEITGYNIYRVNLKKTGTVTVTASTLDGLYQTKQVITVINTKPYDKWIDPTIDKGYEEYYIDNEDGITLIKYDGKYVSEEDGETIYYVPAKINGKTVTEIDFKGISFGSSTIVLPSTIKRIADECFAGKGLSTSSGKIILNEGLEEIGEKAFYKHNFKNSDITIPSTVKTIKENAFAYTENIHSVIVESTLLTEIPNSCFEHSTLQNIYFSEECTQLKTIGNKAFKASNLKSINLPDSIEIIKQSAFQGWTKNETGIGTNLNLTLNKLPDQLQVIEQDAFNTTSMCKITFDFNVFPENLKSIEENALKGVNMNQTITIPESIEYIGSNALSGNVRSIETYGHDDSSIGEMNLIQYLNHIEIPSTMRTVNIINQYESSIQLYWTAGMDSFNYKTYDNQSISIYLKEGRNDGTYQFNINSFEWYHDFASTQKNTLNIDYIEIPSNYLDNISSISPTPWLKDVVIVNVGKDVQLDQYVKVLQSSIKENGSISYKDKNGNMTLLYKKYTKTSQYQYENQEDYQTNGITLLENTVNVKTYNVNNTVELEATLSTNQPINSTLYIKCWQDFPEESINQRAAQLGDYLNFEDLYLRQNTYHYFNLYFENEEKNQGNYVIQLKTNQNYNSYNTGLYKISGMNIERIPIQITNGIITFETDTLGTFALAEFNNLEETIEGNPLEELHNLLDGQEIKIWYENAVTYETNHGTVTIVGEDKNEDSDVVVSKPMIEDEIKEEIIKNNNTNDYTVIKIDTLSNNHSIQIALTQLQDKYNTLHIFKVEENDQPFNLIDITKDSLHSLKDQQVNESIMSNNRDYYQCDLNESGTYYLVLSTSNEKKSYHTEIFSILPIIGGIVIMLLIIKKAFKETREI